jgi:hypothetical protein
MNKEPSFIVKLILLSFLVYLGISNFGLTYDSVFTLHASSRICQNSGSHFNNKNFQYEVTVTLKLIQVFVTDKKGNPVTD